MKDEDKVAFIEAINNTLAVNKTVGTYVNLQKLCIEKLNELIKSINTNK